MDRQEPPVTPRRKIVSGKKRAIAAARQLVPAWLQRVEEARGPDPASPLDCARALPYTAWVRCAPFV